MPHAPQSQPFLPLPEGVGGEEQITNKFLLVLVRIGGPSATKHQQFDLIDRVAIHGQSCGAIGELKNLLNEDCGIW